MERIIEELNREKFIQVSNITEYPIVVHAVAGAGKTTLLHRLLKDLDLRICTTAQPSGFSILGRKISRFSISEPCDILDEYPGAEHPKASKLLLADPFQYSANLSGAHFIKLHTHRFGKNTCALLNRIFNHHFTSDKEDSVVFAGLYQGEPIGQLITLEEETFNLCLNHQLTPLRPCELYGREYNEVTVLLSETWTHYPPHLLYLALTRHQTKLLILSDAVSSTT
ncbi:TGB1 [Cassava Colombian symptomless virus]|uniref:TGB1 n=2 Tax=Alphaflexiviridae TaxID=675064 RepID=V9PRI8_9VIRU|nr:TGB1 [Cassava Colombian symptomless virus]AHA91820.1 TGB1 [Cassava Colombian symptomless virus]